MQSSLGMRRFEVASCWPLLTCLQANMRLGATCLASERNLKYRNFVDFDTL